MVGYNYRMTEIECAIGIQQLQKLPALLQQRLENVAFFHEQLAAFPALELQPVPAEGSQHTYYVYPIKFNKEIAGLERNVFVQALSAELPSAVLRETAPLIGTGYVRPLYLQPIYQQKAHWALQQHGQHMDYSQGLCPVTEQMHFERLFTHEYMRPGMSRADMEDVVRAFDKVFSNIHELQTVAQHA